MDHTSSPSSGWASCVSVGGLASLGCAGLLWYLYKEEGAKTQQLNGIQYHENLDDLRKLGGRLPQLVAVRGRVNSRNPVKCQLSDKLTVFHEVLEEELWRKERENGRIVTEPLRLRKFGDTAEWFLEDGSSTTRVKVENVAEAERLSSVLGEMHLFVPEPPSLRGGMAQFIMEKTWHMAKLGVRKTERYLPVGSIVTVVGQLDQSILTLDPTHQGEARQPTTLQMPPPPSASRQLPSPPSPSSSTAPPSSSSSSSGWMGLGALRSILPTASNPSTSSPPQPSDGPRVFPAAQGQGQGQGQGLGQLVLRKPPVGGGPFIITPMTMQQLTASMSSTARVYQYAAVGLGAVGAALVLRKLLVRILHRWRDAQSKKRMAQMQEQVRKRLAARAAMGPAASDASSQGGTRAPEPQEGDRAAGTCVVCIDKSAEMVFTSCGHLCCCETCSSALNRCPVCRVRGGAIKVYRP